MCSVWCAPAGAADGRPGHEDPGDVQRGGRAGRHRDVQIFALRAPNRVHPRCANPPTAGGTDPALGVPRLGPIGSVACVAVAFHPSAVRGAGSDGPGEIDYRLARQSVISEYRKGRLARHDVCDAHPELVRAAREVGEPSSRLCPICEDERVVLVSYVFGPRLAVARPLHHESRRAGPAREALGVVQLLRGRGVPRLLVEPPGADVPAHRRRPVAPPPAEHAAWWRGRGPGRRQIRTWPLVASLGPRSSTPYLARPHTDPCHVDLSHRTT